MNSQEVIKKSLWLVIFIFFANSLAMRYHWYFSLWWYDMPMHFLGGVFIGLVSLGLYLRYFSKTGDSISAKKAILISLLSVLVIGILWEVFEFSIDTFITYRLQSILDTSSDIFFDLAGGCVSALYFIKKSRNLV